MKRSLSILIAMICTCATFAQEYRDVVFLKNGSVIKGFYKELYPRDTLRMETLDGSLLVCPMSDVVRIAKERTDVYVINKEDESLTFSLKWRTHSYSASFELVYGTNVEDAGAKSYGIYTTHGYRFNRHLFLGAGLGLEKYDLNVSNLTIESSTTTIPVYAETRFYLMNTRIAPVVVCRGGYSICGIKGAFVCPGIGVDFGISPRSAGYIHLMYRWQHCSYDIPDLQTKGFPKVHVDENGNYLAFVAGFRF